MLPSRDKNKAVCQTNLFSLIYVYLTKNKNKNCSLKDSGLVCPKSDVIFQE